MKFSENGLKEKWLDTHYLLLHALCCFGSSIWRKSVFPHLSSKEKSTLSDGFLKISCNVESETIYNELHILLD